MSFGKIFLIALLIAGLIIGILKAKKEPSDYFVKVKIKDKIFNLEVPENNNAGALGLSGRKSMPENHGMLFRFDSKETHVFWMRGMEFPLDFIWLEGNVIKDLSENIPVPASDEPENMSIIAPRIPIDSVIEVNAGIINKLQLREGDKIEFLN